MPPARAVRTPSAAPPAKRVAAPAPAAPTARRAPRGDALGPAGPAVRLTPARTARPAAVPVPAGGGDPLPAAVRKELEGSLGVDLRRVRVHTDGQAHELARSLSARAVTYGHHIFLGAGERPTDLALMGHEVAHVVQQQAAPRVQPWSARRHDPFEHEAGRASAAVVSGQPFTVRERTSAPRAQRLGISDALDYFADKANNIPGFRMLTIILGVNPINMSSVDRSAANILRALIEFMPGGGLITQALDGYGIFDKVGAWIQGKVAQLGMVGSLFKQAISDFLDSLSWTDIFDLGDVWRRAKRIFTDPIDKLIDFGKGVVVDILKFIKEAILKPLAALAEGTPAWELLTAVLGENPITGDKVAQDADALIGGFMKLIGQEEIYNNIKKANALSRAWAWFKGALAGLLGFVRQIPSLFIAALESLELFDVVLPPRAFLKVGRVFANFFKQFVSWGLEQVLSLLQIIFEVVAPGAVPYVKKAAGAFKTIIQDPISFIKNLVKAGVQGFKQFASRFLTHLRKSIIDWLTGTLSTASVYIPQSFDFTELLKFVLSVLGLTWQNIRQKLVKAIGETPVKVLETGFDILVTLVTKGPAAAWQQIKEGLSNLKQMAMDAIMDYVKWKVVEEAVKKLVSFLSPVGAFIQAIIAIYNTIMFFIERLKQIARVAMSFIDSIAAIAAGSIASAANRVEQTMAGLLTLVISFLARFAGLGNVSKAVIDLINKIRTPIDKALDRVVTWIVTMAKKVGKLLVKGGQAVVANAKALALRLTRRRSFAAAGESHAMWITEQGDPQVESRAMPLGTRIGTWRRRLKTLPATDQPKATAGINTAAGLNDTLRREAQNALKARTAGNAVAIDAAQQKIDTAQASLQPVLVTLFTIFGDTKTAQGAQAEAEYFALMEAYDRTVVPLQRQGLVTGTPASVSQTFRSLWNANRFPQARGFATHMERVLAVAKNVGTGRYPYLTGVEVRISGARVDYTTRDRDVQQQVDLDVATEVKHWGAMRDRTTSGGTVLTVAQQVQRRMATLDNQIQSSLRNATYSVVVLEVRGIQNSPRELRDALASALLTYRNLANTLKKKFVYRRI